MLITRFMICALCLLSAGAHTETLADKAFGELKNSPPTHDGHFDFVVLGDSRATEPHIMPPVFHKMIREWNLLQPTFVVDVGDLILGGAAELLDTQWDVFEAAVAECDIPFIPIPGNHDVTDPSSEEIYTRRIGPMNFSFEYGNALFVALNSEEHGQVDSISEKQKAWLGETLDNSKQEHVFIFVHKPYFEGNWEKSWAEVHAILKQHPVRMVVGCDWHLYRDCGTHDGIRYVITGGGGAEIRTPEEEGGFNHYLWVKVRGDETHFTVMRPGGVLAPDTVTKERIDEIHGLRESMYTDTLRLPFGEDFSGDVEFHIQNSQSAVLEIELIWHVPETWQVTPDKKAIRAEPGQTISSTFSFASSGAARFPVPEFEFSVEKPRYGEAITIRKRLDLVPTLEVHRAKQAPLLDGKLDEWKKVPKVPLSYGWDYDVRDTDDLAAVMMMQWDPEYLYLAVVVEDDEFYQPYAGDIVWSADNVQLFLGNWEWGLTLTTKGEEVFLYGGSGRERETVNTAVRLGVERDGRKTTYEAAFPLSELTPLRLEEGQSFRFSIVVNDLDPSTPDRPRHWAELTPGVGNAIPDSPLAEITLRD